jgi:2-polyprenyl-3-methyl-5-hydroxy-6-metoxy-1,4-benzoquinol methylase
MSWSDGLSDSYYKINILNSPELLHFFQKELYGICQDRNVLDLGCGDGTLHTLIPHRHWVNVDLFTKRPDLVIKKDAILYLQEQKPSSFDVILCCFALHHFYTPQFRELVMFPLSNNGQFINFSISRTSPLFSDGGFNRVFFGKGFSDDTLRYDMIRRESVAIKINAKNFSHFIRERSWSNLAKMSDGEITYLLERIPKGLDMITLTIKIGMLEKKLFNTCLLNNMYLKSTNKSYSIF